jgi:pimeloyl-ACP methyl ester carboxylesterase
MRWLLRRGSLLLALLLLAQPSAALRDTEPRSPGTVILLHGLGRSVGSMTALERALAARGYSVRNVGYPSREADLEELVVHLDGEVKRCCEAQDVPVHFVTHSMGGILVRAFLAEHRPKNLGRVVMLAPPNGGSEWVDALRDSHLFALAGPAASELGTDAESAPTRLGPVDFELGVLIGNKSWNPLGSWLIPGDDDGTVAVDSARIEGMKDFRVVDESHTFIVRSPEVIAEVIHFLEHGEFSRVHVTGP